MGELLHQHIPCKYCGSSDAGSIYEGQDGKQWFKCFSCDVNRLYKGTIELPKETKPSELKLLPAYIKADNGFQFRDIEPLSYVRYHTRLTEDGDILFPYFTNSEITAFKVRKFIPDNKVMYVDGTITGADLFGQSSFTKGGKYITIVEGEYDAIAAYQMMGSKWPVVSIKTGAKSALKDCQLAYEWLDSFENIVIAFDNDDQGKSAAKAVAELFSGKSKIVNLKLHKDANEYLTAGAAKAFMDEWWKAEAFVPDGIIPGASLWNLVSTPVDKAQVMYPYAGLNKLTYGIRLGELVTITAGSGLGKSQFVREVAYSILNQSQDNIGLMFLEESVKRSGLSIMSLAANKPLHLPDTVYTQEELKNAFDSTLGTGRIFLFDHFGSTSVQNILNRTRYMAKALNCKYIFLDHVSIIVSAQDNGDERKAIDEVMTKLRMFVQETNIALILVSHLKRPEGKGHEEGAATSLNQLRGSGSIGQLSDMVIGLERNGQAENMVDRNTTRVRVVKNRFSGLTGPSCSCYYDLSTGRMTEVDELSTTEVL